MRSKILAILAFLVTFSGVAEAHYNPKMGRFMSRDPIEERGGSNNIYEFVRNEPLGSLDIYGLAVNVSRNEGSGTHRPLTGETYISDSVDKQVRDWILKTYKDDDSVVIDLHSGSNKAHTKFDIKFKLGWAVFSDQYELIVSLINSHGWIDGQPAGSTDSVTYEPHMHRKFMIALDKNIYTHEIYHSEVFTQVYACFHLPIIRTDPKTGLRSILYKPCNTGFPLEHWKRNVDDKIKEAKKDADKDCPIKIFIMLSHGRAEIH